MQVKVTTQSNTEALMSVIAKSEELHEIKDAVIKQLGRGAKVPGFREGKAPTNLLEKQLDPQLLQQTFLEEAINQMYPQAVRQQRLRPVANPEIQIKKFVPFTALEFDAKIPVVQAVQLPNYKQIKLKKPSVDVTAQEVNDVIEDVRERLADSKDVERPAKNGDKVWIDFVGKDNKEQPIKGADGKDYPLILGSKSFIPGFEDNLIGVKAKDKKTFTLTFPKDYGVSAMANKKVTFDVEVTKVQEIKKPKIDDELAKKAGPFQTLKQLKDDIKMQLQQEKDNRNNLQYESDLVRKITEKSKVEIPNILIEQTIDKLVQEQKQNVVYRGQTYQEFLKQEGKTEEEFRKTLEPVAEERVKASLVLSEVADKEALDVTPEELEVRIQTLKGQYGDQQMQAELDKPEVRRDIAMRMLSEKTVAKLAEYAQNNSR